MFLVNSSSQSIAEKTIRTPITAPMYQEMIMATIDHGLYFVLVDYLIATAKVTAGLKCVPHTGDKKITNAQNVKPTAKVILPPIAPQLIAIIRNIVPRASKQQI